MTLTAIGLCIVCQILIVFGQILLKRGMSPAGIKTFALNDFLLGILLMAIWFFLWLGLMGKWDLSKLFPFEGLNPAFMALAAWLILKEKLPPTAWIGVGLVCVGIAVVSLS